MKVFEKMQGGKFQMIGNIASVVSVIASLVGSWAATMVMNEAVKTAVDQGFKDRGL